MEPAVLALSQNARQNDDRAWLAAGVCLLGACAIYAALSRGIWIDELWSLHLGDPEVPFAEYFHRRLLHEANPMTANALYRLVAMTGIDDIGPSRLSLNLPGYAMLVGASVGFTRASPARSPFYLVFAVLVVGLPAFITTFADYRSYFLQLCCGTILLQFLYRLIAEDADAPAKRWLKALGMASVAGTVLLHFLTGLIGSVTIGAALLYLARERRWRAFASVAAPSAAVWLLMPVLAVWQYSHFRHDFDFGWIRTTTMQAAEMGGGAILAALLINPVGTVFALFARTLSPVNTRELAPQTARYAVVLVAGLVLSGLLMLAANSVQPMFVPRYLTFWQLTVCAIVAALCARAVTATRLRMAALVGVASVSIGMTTIAVARERNWGETRDFIANTVRRCPETRVYALSVWDLTRQAQSNYAAFERPTIIEGYRRLAHDAGFVVTIVERRSPPLVLGTGCPTLLWIEHLVDRAGPDPRSVLTASGLGFDKPARLGWFKTANGLVLIARPIVGARVHGE